MPCELCGRETKGCKEAIIDGAKMYVCPDCIKYAEGGVQHEEPVSRGEFRPTPAYRTPPTFKPRKAPPKDIYQSMQKELVSNWNHLIEAARKKKGLSREELGFKIGERTVTIAKLENGDLRPSDQIITKLEKELGITLLEEIKEGTPTLQQTRSQTKYTLGDFIKPDK
jgi:putative transcription factor